MRPENHPYWPVGPERLPPAMIAPCRLFLQYVVDQGGEVPQWTATALWWAALTVHFELSVEGLAKAIQQWEESYLDALGWFYSFRANHDESQRKVYWGFHEDLKQTGSLERAKKLDREPELLRTVWERITVDDWIVDQSGPGDIVITADIPLAARCLTKEALVLDPRGYRFTDNDIGSALATRQLLEELRQVGVNTGGPATIAPKDRSRFLAKLDDSVNAVRRAYL